MLIPLYGLLIFGLTLISNQFNHFLANQSCNTPYLFFFRYSFSITDSTRLDEFAAETELLVKMIWWLAADVLALQDYILATWQEFTLLRRQRIRNGITSGSDMRNLTLLTLC